MAETVPPTALAPAIELEGSKVLVGTCSWTDATLVKETDWYPRRSMSAAERLAYYASRFPVVETDSTYYFPPTPDLAESWAQRTPPGFTMNVKAYSLLTGHPTFPHSLWPDLQGEVPHEHRDKRRLYDKHLPIDVVDEVWGRFRHSLRPLHEAGKLGAVLLQYPRWFGPKEANRDYIRAARRRLPDYRLCVEFRNGRWIEGDECERTFAFLEEEGLSFVCVDEPAGFPSSLPPVVAVTSDLAVVRFHGRNAETWEQDLPTAALRFRYLYRDDELAEWVPKVHELAASASEVHLLMNNCYRDQAVVNGTQLAEMLRGDDGGSVESPREAAAPEDEPRQQRLGI
jgi:uncharacterized protein YecE (DUF72 family)